MGDLFGDPLRPGVGNLKAYAALPGTGPDGKRCSDCAHCVRCEKFNKCGLMRAIWTHGPGTDIKTRTPACSKFEQVY